jgi:glycosyltransferase involved in cell wall biosynthesis
MASLTPVPYPEIPPVASGVERPFWSVMIPTYNCAGYLAYTIRSVLDQTPLAGEMQIEVIDDHSDRDDPAEVTRRVGGDRVTFFRQPSNVGPQATFTTCVRRARGHWVHILHGDDMVRDGYYAALRRGIEQAPSVHAAFCRVMTIDASNHWLEPSPLERHEPGIVPDLLERLAVFNGIMFPSIAVRRSAYEALGGFHPELFHAADWDMWKRIAAHYPVWYEPEALALYRIHQQSDTSRLMRTGANIRDARHAIAIAERYLPADRAARLSREARLHHALYAIELAQERMQTADWAGTWAQVRAAFACSSAWPVWKALFGLFAPGRTSPARS